MMTKIVTLNLFIWSCLSAYGQGGVQIYRCVDLTVRDDVTGKKITRFIGGQLTQAGPTEIELKVTQATDGGYGEFILNGVTLTKDNSEYRPNPGPIAGEVVESLALWVKDREGLRPLYCAKRYTSPNE
jgi:hypothetical protein